MRRSAAAVHGPALLAGDPELVSRVLSDLTGHDLEVLWRSTRPDPVHPAGPVRTGRLVALRASLLDALAVRSPRRYRRLLRAA